MGTKTNNVPARLAFAAGQALLFLMLFVPTSYQLVKAALLALLLAAVLIHAALHSGAIPLSPRIFVWTLGFCGLGAAFMAIGAWNGAPGALRVGTVYVLWPALFTLLISGISSEHAVRRILATVIWSSVLIGVYGITFIMHSIGWWPDVLYIEIDQGQEISFKEGFVEYNMYSISTLLFLVPFLFSALLLWSTPQVLPVPRAFLWIAFIVCLALALLSGRRALWLIMLCAPVIHCWLRPKRLSRRRANGRKVSSIRWLLLLSAGGAVFAYLQSVLGLDFVAMTNEFLSAFDYSGTRSASLRADQAAALVTEWGESPLIGRGHGAVANAVIRDPDIPWAYELSYLALLFQTGIAGVVGYALFIGWILWQGLRISREASLHGIWMLPVLVGFTSFLIGNATNPYLQKFDFIWVVFLPLAIINRHFLQSARRGTAEE